MDLSLLAVLRGYIDKKLSNSCGSSGGGLSSVDLSDVVLEDGDNAFTATLTDEQVARFGKTIEPKFVHGLSIIGGLATISFVATPGASGGVLAWFASTNMNGIELTLYVDANEKTLTVGMVMA